MFPENLFAEELFFKDLSPENPFYEGLLHANLSAITKLNQVQADIRIPLRHTLMNRRQLLCPIGGSFKRPPM